MKCTLKILAMEPFFGGSHASFLEGLAENSVHDVTLWTLPAKLWKWRMRTAAFWAADRFQREKPEVDIIFASDFLDVATFRGLAQTSRPIVTFFHENQITYPMREDEERDNHFGITNISTAIASNGVWFNSKFHLDEYCRGVKAFAKRSPLKDTPDWSAIDEKKMEVKWLGLDPSMRPGGDKSGPLRILWNHRWEHDKRPDVFERILLQLKEAGLEFRVVVLGDDFSGEQVDRLKDRFANQLDHVGFLGNRSEYIAWLQKSDVVVSCADHEFFGLSILEACLCGTKPLLPNRLSYPELFEPEDHEFYFYASESELFEKLKTFISSPETFRKRKLYTDLTRFYWQNRIDDFDTGFEKIASLAR